MEGLSQIERKRLRRCEIQRKWRAENPEKHNAMNMRAYKKIIDKDPEYWRSETGKFRGWLCHKCNTGIGMLGDSLGAVSKAVEYLKRIK